MIIIRAGKANGLQFSPALLSTSASRFDSVPVFIDHAGFNDRHRAGGRSIRDLVGVVGEPAWHAEGREIRARLQLAQLGEWVRKLIDAFAARPHLFGLSADMWITRDGERVIAIETVNSVDIVVNPAAGGRFLTNRPPGDGPELSHGGHETQLGKERNMYLETPTERIQQAGGNPEFARQAMATAATTKASGTNPPHEAPPSGAAPAGTQADGGTYAELNARLLEMELAQRELPESLKEQVRCEFQRTHSLPAATDLMHSLATAWAEANAQPAIRGLGRIQAMKEPTDRIALAFERLMGLPETGEHRDVARLTGIREMYDLLTGDYERRGIFQPQRVTLANATTTTMAQIVANVLNKVMLKAFELRPQWWKSLVYEEDFPNMQDVKWLTLGGFSDLDTVTEGNAYTEKTWDDYAESASFVKKGNYIGLTLEMIDRDDVGAVRAIPRRLGHAANRTLSAAVAALFTANSGVGPTLADSNPLFDAGNHGNLLTAALDADAWDAVIQAMFKQSEYHSSKRLGIRPKFCLVPIELEKSALTIFTSDQEPGTANNDANVRRYSGQVVTVPEWTDANDWAALADPNELEGVCIGYRFGRTPELFVASDPLMGSMFTNDEMRIKVRFVYALGIGDYRAMHKNNVS